MADNYKKYFLAANSFEGFVSHFEDNYSAENGYNTYIIKGGPGTGKSSFMKLIASKAFEKGYTVDLCPCSSDPNSLDGIIIEDIKTVVIDGTSPHSVEPEYPGVCEEIIDLGRFWNSEILKEKRFEIISATNINKALHKTASRYLSACKEIANDTVKTANTFIKIDKILKFSEKICKRYIEKTDKEQGYENIRFIEGTTPFGLIGYPKTVTENFDTIIVIDDKYGAVSSIIMDLIRSFALNRGHNIITLKNPFLPTLNDHILIPDISTAFVTENEYIRFETESRRIHIRRFVDIQELNRKKPRLNFNRKVKRDLLLSAIDTLNKAKISHDILEEYYINAMDFEALSAFANETANRIIR